MEIGVEKNKLIEIINEISEKRIQIFSNQNHRIPNRAEKQKIIRESVLESIINFSDRGIFLNIHNKPKWILLKDLYKIFLQIKDSELNFNLSIDLRYSDIFYRRIQISDFCHFWSLNEEAEIYLKDFFKFFFATYPINKLKELE